MAPPPADYVQDDDLEDNFSIGLFGEQELIFSPTMIRLGPVEVQAAPKDGQAIHMMADQVFSSGLVLAEMIDLALIPVANLRILELGSGAGLPSLLSSTLDAPPKSVLLTDYPDASITDNLQANVQRNLRNVREGCRVDWRPFEWGADVGPLLETLDDPKGGFDLIFLADLLWLTPSLKALAKSCSETLVKTKEARVWIIAGDYTRETGIDLFFSTARSYGFAVSDPLSFEPEWKGRFIEGLVGPEDEASEQSWREALGRRKRRVKGWTMGWSPELLDP